MMEAVKQVPSYVSICKTMWGVSPKIIMVTDSQPLLGWLRTGRAMPDPHFQGPLDLVLERVGEYKVDVRWVDAKQQRADTKLILDRHVNIASK